MTSCHLGERPRRTTTLLTTDATHVTIPNTRLLGPSRILRADDASSGVRALSAEWAIGAAEHSRLRDICVRLETLLGSQPAVLSSAMDGALRTAVTTSAGPGNTLRIRMQTYLDVNGRSEADVERIRCWILARAAAVVFPASATDGGGGEDRGPAAAAATTGGRGWEADDEGGAG